MATTPSGFNPESSSSEQGASHEAFQEDLQAQATHLKDKASQVAEQTKEQMRQAGIKIQTGIDKAMDTTADSLEATSHKISSIATYFREQNSEKLAANLKETVRRNPTQSLLASLFIGFLVGRAIR